MRRESKKVESQSIKIMSKYKVKQSFSYADPKTSEAPQEVSYEAGTEIELDDAKAAEIGLSYLEKVEDGSSEPTPPAEPPKEGGAEGSESQQDTPPAGEGGDNGAE